MNPDPVNQDKPVPRIDRESIPEFRSSSRWPWMVAVVAIVVVVAVSVRLCRHGDRPAPLTPDPAPKAKSDPVETSDKRAVVPTEVAQPVPVASTNAAQGIERVRTLLAKGSYLNAREETFLLLASAESASDRSVLEDLLGQIHTNMVFTQAPMPEKTNHVIQASERLEAIAKRYKTTVELLQAGNGIANPARIRKGDLLRPLVGTFRIEVRRTSRELVLYLNDRFFKRYTVGIGKHDKTPLGSFVVVDRVKEPVWWHPDGRQVPYGHPENILGTRWLALKATGQTPDLKGYGIHGTSDESSVGKSESAGCVRMHNRDVEELFVLVPVGTVVQIVDK